MRVPPSPLRDFGMRSRPGGLEPPTPGLEDKSHLPDAVSVQQFASVPTRTTHAVLNTYFNARCMKSSDGFPLTLKEPQSA